MKRVLRGLGWIAFWSYVAALFVLGTFGVVAPGLELASLYDLSLAPLADAEAASVLHQVRFLKVFVLGIGVLAVMFRHEILRPGLAHRLFVGFLFAAAGARLLSIQLDGMPHPRLVSFTVSELVMGLLILIAARVGAEHPARPQAALSAGA